MNLFHKYWYFKEAISPKTCDEIIRYGLSQKNKEQIAFTGDPKFKRDLMKKPPTKKELKDLRKTRNSNVTWLDDRWIYDTVQPFVRAANKNAGWNFQWDWSEPCQFTRYSKGQFYDWHCDSWDVPYTQEGSTKGKIRKLAGTVSLSDPKDYVGGELEFDYRNKNPKEKTSLAKCTEIAPKGSVVVFPSSLWHRVCPVKRGTRYSLVMWNLGLPFK